jgi:ribosome-associated translation inhibitor RaiA
MQILIRSINTELNNNIKQYLRRKVLKYDMLLVSSSVVECTFEQKGGSKRDGNKIIHLSMRLPGAKKPLFVKSKALSSFEAAIDMADNRLRRVVDKYLDLKKFDGKRHRYYLSKIKKLPGGLWRKVKRRK